MRVAYLAAGAANMLCGSCLRDNRLAATLIEQGRDVLLIPLYTPLRSDEPSVARPTVYFGGLNVYLQQVSSLFRRTPRWIDRLLDARPVLRAIGRLSANTRPEALGALTVSVLRGEDGRQRKEVQRLAHALRELAPDLINLPNLMFVGLARRLKSELNVPIVCTLSGEDVFLDGLSQPHRTTALDLIRRRAADVDGFIAVTRYYADHAAERFGLPRDRVHAVPMGVRVDDFDPPADPPPEPFTIGYLARICPEKGLANLCEAFIQLRASGRNCRLRVAGYLSPADRPYLHHLRRKIDSSAATGRFEYLAEVTRDEKLALLRSLHALSVPTTYHEAKGLYILEALAAGVPVVQPRHGSFPELIESTGGGLLYDASDADALARALGRLMDEPELRRGFAHSGRNAVRESFTDRIMADRTWELYRRHLERCAAAP